MTAIIVFAAFIVLFIAAGIASALDMRPEQRPPEWSVGRLMQRRS